MEIKPSGEQMKHISLTSPELIMHELISSSAGQKMYILQIMEDVQCYTIYNLQIMENVH